jgi:hypothetical protein
MKICKGKSIDGKGKNMKWIKFPSTLDLEFQRFAKYEAIDGIEDIPHGLVIAFYLSIRQAKEMRRRKHNEISRVTKVHC